LAVFLTVLGVLLRARRHNSHITRGFSEQPWQMNVKNTRVDASMRTNDDLPVSVERVKDFVQWLLLLIRYVLYVVPNLRARNAKKRARIIY